MGIFQSKSGTGSGPGKKLPVDQSAQMSSLDRAKLEVRTGRNRLTKWSKNLERDMANLQNAAKECMLANKKEKALMLLKLRKLKASALKKAQGQLLNIETMLLEMESSEINIDVMGAVKKGTEALNAIHKIMAVEGVEELLEESDEAIALANEINEVLGMSDSADIDMDEVEEELNALVQDEVTSNAVKNLPDAPTGEISVAEPSPGENADDGRQRDRKQRVLVTS